MSNEHYQFGNDKQTPALQVDLLRISAATPFVRRACLSVVLQQDCEINRLTQNCEMCSDKDGCNSAAQYGPIVMMVAIPIAILKLFLL